MEIVDYLLARKKAGGGSDVTIKQLTATENGTYSEEGIAYSPVVVNVPAPENSYQLTDIPTGTVSTIDDGTDLPMSSLKVGIEPVQDLHGYDHPWVGGAGKNLLQNTATTQTVNGVTYTVNTDGTVNISGTATADTIFMLNTVTLQEGNYIVSGGINNNCYINVTGKANSYGTDVSFSVASGGETLTTRLYIVSGTTASGTYKPMIRLATETDATFEPYSNICPISGWTAANVMRTGKNLYKAELDNYYLDTVTGLPVAEAGYEVSEFIPISANQSIYIPQSDSARRWFYDKFKNPKTYLQNADNQIYTAQEDGYIRITLNKKASLYSTYQIEYGSTATTYEPYNGQTYTIEFKDGDNPLTVYGGTLDVTTGELVVDRVYKEFDGTENWTRYATGENNTSFNLYSSISNATSYNGQISNQLNFNIQAYDVTSDRKYTFAVEPTNGRRVFIQVPTSVASTNEAFKTWLTTQKANNTPVAISVKITPTTYHLTPVQVRTLVGNNNIWADTGDVLSGKYFKEL